MITKEQLRESIDKYGDSFELVNRLGIAENASPETLVDGIIKSPILTSFEIDPTEPTNIILLHLANESNNTVSPTLVAPT